MAVEFGKAVPVFRIYSYDKAREFYVDFLGFTWDREHRFDDNAPLYARVMKVQDPFGNRLTFAELK